MGEDLFQTNQIFDPSYFVYFKKRIGENGLEFLLEQKTRYGQQVARLRFRAIAAIEPYVSHLKSKLLFRFNSLKGGVAGDISNAPLSGGIGYNLKMRFNQLK